MKKALIFFLLIIAWAQTQAQYIGVTTTSQTATVDGNKKLRFVWGSNIFNASDSLLRKANLLGGNNFTGTQTINGSVNASGTSYFGGVSSVSNMPFFGFQNNGDNLSELVFGAATITPGTPVSLIGFRLGGDRGQNGAPAGLFGYRFENRNYGLGLTIAGVNANQPGQTPNHFGVYQANGTSTLLYVDNLGTIKIAAPVASTNGTDSLLVRAIDGTIKKIAQSAIAGGVTSFAGRTGAIVPQIGDYSAFYATPTQVNAKQNLVTLTTTGTSGAATFNQATGALNIPNYNTDLSNENLQTVATRGNTYTGRLSTQGNDGTIYHNFINQSSIAMAPSGQNNFGFVNNSLFWSNGTLNITRTLRQLFPASTVTRLPYLANSTLADSATVAANFVPNTRIVAGFPLSSDITLASLTPGFGVSGSAYNGSIARIFAIDTTVIRTAANSPTLAQLQTKFNAKLNATDTATEATRYVKIATTQTVIGQKTFSPSTATGATQSGTTFGLTSTATQNNGTYNSVVINAPNVTLGSFTGLTSNALSTNGNVSIGGILSGVSISTSGSINANGGLFTNFIAPITSTSNVAVGGGAFNFGTATTSTGEFIIGSSASNRGKLQISGVTYGSSGTARAISVAPTLNPSYSNDKLIGLDLSLITFGTGAGGVLTATETTSGTANATASNVIVIFTGGTGTGYRRVVNTTNGSSSIVIQSGGANSMGAGYTVGDVLTATLNNVTITETVTAVGLTGTASYDVAMKTSRVLQAPTTLLTTPLVNTTEYDGTRLYQTNSAGTRNGIAYLSDVPSVRTPIPVTANATMVLNADYLNTSASQYTLTLPATTGFSTDGSKIITALTIGTGGSIIIRVPSGYALQSGSTFATTTGTGGATLTQGTKVQLIPVNTNSWYLQVLNGSITLY